MPQSLAAAPSRPMQGSALDDAGLLRDVIDSLSLGIAVAGAGGQFEILNSRFFDMARRAGLVRSDFAALDDADLVRRPMLEVMPALAANPRRAAGAGRRIFEVTVDDGFAGNARLVVLRDITEHHMAMAGLEEALAETEAGARTRRTLVSQVAHSFRTPLDIIIGYAGIMIDCGGQVADPDEAVAHLSYIRDAASALLLTLNDMVDYLRLEDAVDPDKGVYDVGEIWSGVQDMCRAQTLANGVEIELSQVMRALYGVDSKIDRTHLRHGLAQLLRIAEVLSPSDGTITVTAGVTAAEGIRLSIAFTAGRVAPATVLRSLERDHPIAEVSLTGHVSGYALMLARRHLEVAGARLLVTAEEEADGPATQGRLTFTVVLPDGR